MRLLTDAPWLPRANDLDSWLAHYYAPISSALLHRRSPLLAMMRGTYRPRIGVWRAR